MQNKNTKISDYDLINGFQKKIHKTLEEKQVIVEQVVEHKETVKAVVEEGEEGAIEKRLAEMNKRVNPMRKSGGVKTTFEVR